MLVFIDDSGDPGFNTRSYDPQLKDIKTYRKIIKPKLEDVWEFK